MDKKSAEDESSDDADEKSLAKRLGDIMRENAEKAGMTELELFNEICDLGEQERYGFVLPKPYDPNSDDSVSRY